MHVYEVRPRKDKRGVDLISDALPFGRLWYGEPDAISNALGYAKFFSRSHDAVIRVLKNMEPFNHNTSAKLPYFCDCFGKSERGKLRQTHENENPFRLSL